MSTFANLSISRKLTVAFAAVVAVIFVSGTLAYSRLSVIEGVTGSRVHTADVLDAQHTMMRAMLDQETGVRGYLVTGDESFLDPYHKGGDAFTMAFQKARRLTLGNPAQEGRLDELDTLVKQWRAIAEQEITLMARPETREEARSLEGARAGKTVMDLIRAKVDEVDAIERAVLAKRAAVQRQAYATAYTVAILGGTASLVTAILMGLLLTRSITVPVRRMTSAMAALAKGEAGVEVPGVGRNDEIGAMAAAVQIFRDNLIDHNRAKEALRESEEKWRAVFENNPTMYFMLDATGTVLSANPFGAEKLGYTVDELAGDTVLKIFHAEDRAAAQRNMMRCLDQRGRAVSWELRKVRKDGSTLWVRETGKAMLLKESPVLLIVCEDITDRKWAEYLTAHVFESSPDGICMFERDYRYQRVNPAYGRSFGMSAEKVVGKHAADLLGAEAFANIVKPNLDRCFAGEEVSYAAWFSYPAGQRYRVVTCSPLRLRAERVEAALVIIRDLTEQMLASEALRVAQAELAHANRVAMMGLLTASIAHEVNQPIAAAVTNAHAALRWLAAQPPALEEVRQAAGRIIENGRRASDVIERIRAMTKKAPPRKECFDLNEAILDVISLSRSEMLSHGVLLRTGLATGLEFVCGDRVQSQQVILNLIVNAIEAMSGVDEGARELRISSERDVSGSVLVTIEDSGPGLDPQQMERVFEAFYTTKPEGMGLGLAICRSIIAAQGGRLWASANEPRGTIFRFTVPLEQRQKAAAF
ncbi:PAS domain S-box protein [Acidocella sp.]|jgi:PAS domain S-box-containing protein|uniref:PAS domain S-box protein n=1 Tax=Acidocella sp. TaxID=50710 RepID=UPI002F3ECBC3